MCPIETRHLVLSYLLFCILFFALSLFTSLIIYPDLGNTAYASELSSSGNNLGGDDNSNDNDNSDDGPYGVKRQSLEPVINDPKLKLEVVSKGLELPTQMAFLGQNDILVLEKNSGIVKRIVNGTVLGEPLLDVNVATFDTRGMLGITVTKNETRGVEYVFLYFTQAGEGLGDGQDRCESVANCIDGSINQPSGNVLYRYELSKDGKSLTNKKLLLNFSSLPSATHNGGKMVVGPDNNIYIITGNAENKTTPVSNSKKIQT